MASHNPKYDTAAHARARKRLVVTPIRRYGYVLCVTCGKKLTSPAEADAGHDHDDPTGRRYLGPQCHACNRADGGRRGAEATNARRRVREDVASEDIEPPNVYGW